MTLSQWRDQTCTVVMQPSSPSLVFYSAASCGSPLTVPSSYRSVCTGESSAHVLLCAPLGVTRLPAALRAYAPQIRGTL